MSEIKDIYLSELAKIKSTNKWVLVGFSAVLVLLAILLITTFKKHSDSEQLNALNEQQNKLDSLLVQQKQASEQDRLRDSIYWVQYVKNSKQREAELSTTKKRSDEVINRINQPDFNADSIKKWWADN